MRDGALRFEKSDRIVWTGICRAFPDQLGYGDIMDLTLSQQASQETAAMCTKRYPIAGVVLSNYLLLVLAIPAPVARGEHLYPLPDTAPDIFVARIYVDYDAKTGHFTAHGTARSIDFDGAAPPDHLVESGSFGLNAYLDKTTGALTSGTLSIVGKIPSLGINSVETLLTGTLSEFGFSEPPGGELFEFFFKATDGRLQAYYSANGILVLNAVNSGFKGRFDTDFDSFLEARGVKYGVGTADVFLSPEPTAAVAWSFLGPVVLVGVIYRWRNARKSVPSREDIKGICGG